MTTAVDTEEFTEEELDEAERRKELHAWASAVRRERTYVGGKTCFRCVWNISDEARGSTLREVVNLCENIDGCWIQFGRVDGTGVSPSLIITVDFDGQYLSGRTPACPHDWGYGFVVAMNMVKIANAAGETLTWTQGSHDHRHGSWIPEDEEKKSNVKFTVSPDGQFKSREPRGGQHKG